jgi:hemerythrin superfamily protein
MRAEHREIGACLEDLHQKVQVANPESDREEQALAALLEAHNVKEERVLYPAIDSTLNDDERASLFDQMRNIPEERYRVCCGVHEG